MTTVPDLRWRWMFHHGLVVALGLCAVLVAPGTALHAQLVPAGSLRLGIDGGVGFPGDELSGKGLSRPARGSGGVGIEYTFTRALGLQLSWSGGFLQNSATGLFDRKFRNADLPAGFEPFDRASYETSYFGVTLGATLHVPFLDGISPFLLARGGLFGFSSTGAHDDRAFEHKGQSVAIYGGGGGVEVSITGDLAARLTYVASLTTSDLLDGFVYGSGRDGLASLTLGVLWTLPLGEKLHTTVPRATSPAGRAASDVRAASRDVETHHDDTRHSAARDDDALAAGGADPSLTSDDGDDPSASISPLRPVATSGVTARLDARDVAVFADYALAPDVLTLTVQHRSPDPMRLATALEVLHEGRTVATATGSVLLMRHHSQFDVRSFVDVDSLVIDPAYRFAPAEGAYVVRVLLRDDAGGVVSTAETHFMHLDLERTFGMHGARVRYLITARNATVARCAMDRLCFDVFIDSEDPLAPTAQRSRRLSEAGAAPRASGAMLTDVEDPLSLFPPTVLYGDRDTYLSSLVRNAVTRAEVIASARREGLQYVGRPDAIDAVDVTVARLYFAEGSSELGSEARSVLTMLAASPLGESRRHLVLEGMAVAEESSTAEELARARMRTVNDFLKTRGPAEATAADARSVPVARETHPTVRQEARRVDVLLRFAAGK